MPTITSSSGRIESAHDILRQTQRRPLDFIFHPRSIAVIGATEAPGSVGRMLLENLKNGAFTGQIFPVNPKRPAVLGLQAYPNISAVPQKPDLAVIITPP